MAYHSKGQQTDYHLLTQCVGFADAQFVQTGLGLA